MIVYNAEPFAYSSEAIRLWKSFGYDYREGSWDQLLEASFASDATILIVRLAKKVDEAVLDKFPKLEQIFSATTGHDHIDESEIHCRNIKLVSLRGHDEFLRTIPSTAEHTWALLMSLYRNIPKANQHVLEGGWNRDLFRGYQLQNKVLGIIGYGRTGRKVSHYARAFGMKIIYFDPFVTEDLERKRTTLTEVFAEADILSFHVHLSDQTEKMLNAENISYLNDDCYLINTSRGKVWDETVVVTALRQKKIAGVAVDVLSEEMDKNKRSPLRDALKDGHNVIITPHIGGATWDAISSCEEFLVRNALVK